MSLPLKIGLGFTGLAGVSGIGYLGFKKFSVGPKESFKSKYSLAMKDFLSDGTTLGKKLTSLAEASSSPKHPDLVSAKEHKKTNRDVDAKASLEKGCLDIYNKPVDSGFLDDFKNYCSFNNGDKIGVGKTVVSSNGDLSSKWASFNQKGADELYGGFRNVNKPSSDGSSNVTWQGAMLLECQKLSAEIFEGVISDFVEFCSKDG